MSTSATPPKSVRAQILHALDASGQLQRDLNAARRLQRRGVWEPLRQLAEDQEALLDTVERYWTVLTDRGWGVANVGVHVIQAAGALLDQDSEEAADATMASWFDEAWMGRTAARVAAMIDGTPEGRDLFAHRARLLNQAIEHHERGAFAASILTVLAQVEGITAQVTAPATGGPGKLFFTKSSGRRADVVDPTDLASIEASLDRLRDVYSVDVPAAQAEASLSRHGILHGQEVAFDTAVNSAKCWSLLDVLVQWAMPRGRERAAMVAGRRQSVHAGSQAVDDHGRRLDDREFKVTRSALYEVCALASAYARRERSFEARAVANALADDAMSKRGLPLPHGVAVQTSRDAMSFWACRRTISGWWLARGLTLNEHQLVDVWYYSGPDQPLLSPSESPSLWGGKPNEAPPDWQGGDD